MTTESTFTHRLILKGDFQFHGAYASADASWESDRDAPILRDGQGRILLSGKGLAGQLRSRLEKIFSKEEINGLLGSPTRASRLTISDSSLENSCAADSEMRPRVSIHRGRKTALDKGLSDFDVAPSGSVFPLELTLLSNGPNLEKDRHILAWVRKLLEWGAITPGGNSRRGCGHGDLKNASITEFDLTQPEDLAAWLANSEKKPVAGLLAPTLIHQGTGVSLLRLDLRLEFKDGVLVATERGAFESKSDLPAYRMLKGSGKEEFILPGSSIRGVLRQETENLCRARGGTPCRHDDDGASGYCHSERKKSTALDGSDLCPVCRIFGAIGWRAPFAVSDFVMAAGGPKPKLIDHIAVNRFTGGVHGSAKFDEEPVVGSFSGRVILENPAAWQLNILANLGLMIREGSFWMGHSTHRGLGRITGLRIERLSVLQTHSRSALPSCLAPHPGEVERQWDESALRQTWPELRDSIKDHISLPNSETAAKDALSI